MSGRIPSPKRNQIMDSAEATNSVEPDHGARLTEKKLTTASVFYEETQASSKQKDDRKSIFPNLY